MGSGLRGRGAVREVALGLGFGLCSSRSFEGGRDLKPLRLLHKKPRWGLRV